MNGRRERAELIRVRYLYRSLVLKKKIRLSAYGAAKIVGPDCAYHLYSQIGPKGSRIVSDL